MVCCTVVSRGRVRGLSVNFKNNYKFYLIVRIIPEKNRGSCFYLYRAKRLRRN